MSLALLFPGQGTQHPAMLPWLDVMDEAFGTLGLLTDMLGADWRGRLGDAGWASRNNVAQCLLTGVSVAAWQCLEGRVPAPSVIAGYSVGELSAFCAAGVFDAVTAMRLARDRAEAMDHSVAGYETGLLAVHGIQAGTIADACRRHGLAVAIRLATDRVVLGGLADALDRAQAELTTEGARCTRLAINVASHTPWMASATTALAQRVAAMPFSVPRAALVCNFSGAAARSPGDLKRALAGQIASTVLWDTCLDSIAERRVHCVLEVGPGSTLSKLWSERHPDVPARSIDEFRSPDAVVRWVADTLAGG